MIGSLRGRLAAKSAPNIVIECGGVGYELETPMSTFLDLPAPGSELFLHTHLQVREDAQLLYGFATAAEKELFQSLLRVNRVGAKLALAILSGMSVEGFERCVRQEDAARLAKIPGVGKKTAERLILDLRDRLQQSGRPQTVRGTLTPTDDPRGEAFDALCALGYKPAEVTRLIAGIESAELAAEDIIRQALQQAAR